MQSLAYPVGTCGTLKPAYLPCNPSLFAKLAFKFRVEIQTQNSTSRLRLASPLRTLLGHSQLPASLKWNGSAILSYMSDKPTNHRRLQAFLHFPRESSINPLFPQSS